ncbi:MAG: hypothetical protein HFJ80_07385 [Clostridiales bacterium]|nr:hypothetical protein [Clostridiales bacterium]
MSNHDIAQVDTHFQPVPVEGESLAFTDAQTPPIETAGVLYEEGTGYVRLDAATRQDAGEDLAYLARHTAGGRLRFRTDSPVIAVRVELPWANLLPHMPLTGVSGVDVYVGRGTHRTYVSSIFPPNAEVLAYEGAASVYGSTPAPGIQPVVNPCPDAEGLIDVTIDLPLYNGVKRVEIGVQNGCILAPPTPYSIEKPVGVYGSSITQGGCASRPGTCFAAILARWADADHVNLGFSGNAKGQTVIADALARLPMSAFVMDYDYNAEGVDWLERTHEPFFLRIREAQPDLPVIFVTNPNPLREGASNAARFAAIRRTFENARARGDRRVWLVDGSRFYSSGPEASACTVDFLHPNDLGFLRMAEGIWPSLREALALPGR